MRRRQAPVVAPSADRVPAALRAGRCVEVWAPDGEWLTAWRRFGEAERRWLASVGISWWDRRANPLRGKVGSPWSFEFLASTDPERLASKLDGLGLPRSWRPTPADPAEFGPPVAHAGRYRGRRR